MPFGQQVGSMKKLKEGLKGGIGPIKFIPKNGNIMVRFLDEPNLWVKYFEVFDQVRNVGWPVPDDESAPGYPDADMRKTKRYLANVVDVTGDRDEVVALQLPTSLVNQLVIRYERYDTITDRDYELFRSGSGLDTDYGLTPEPASKRNMAKYKPLDLEEALQAAYDAVWADQTDTIEDDEPLTPAPRKAAAARKAPTAAKKSVAKKSVAPRVEPEPEPEPEPAGPDVDELITWATAADEDGDEDSAQRLAVLAEESGINPDDYGTWLDLAQALADQDGSGPDINDVVKAAAEADLDDDDEPVVDDDTYSQEELEAMEMSELRALAHENGIVTRRMTQKQVVAALMGA